MGYGSVEFRHFRTIITAADRFRVHVEEHALAVPGPVSQERRLGAAHRANARVGVTHVVWSPVDRELLDYTHKVVLAPRGKAGTEIEPFKWLNVLLGNLKTAWSGKRLAVAVAQTRPCPKWMLLGKAEVRT